MQFFSAPVELPRTLDRDQPAGDCRGHDRHNWWKQLGSGSTKVNIGSRWVAYWGGGNATLYDNVNGTSGIPFIEKYLMGWDNAKIANNTPN